MFLGFQVAQPRPSPFWTKGGTCVARAGRGTPPLTGAQREANRGLKQPRLWQAGGRAGPSRRDIEGPGAAGRPAPPAVARGLGRQQVPSLQQWMMATPVNTLCSFPFNLQRTTHMQCAHGEPVGQHVPCHPLFGGSVRVPAARGCQPTDKAGPRRGDTLTCVVGGARHGGTLPAGPLCACAPARLPVCAPPALRACAPARLPACAPAHLPARTPVHVPRLSTSPPARLPVCAPPCLCPCPPAHLRGLSTLPPVPLRACPPTRLPRDPVPLGGVSTALSARLRPLISPKRVAGKAQHGPHPGRDPGTWLGRNPAPGAHPGP